MSSTIKHGTCPVCGQTVALYGDTSYYEGCCQTHSHNGERCDGAQQPPLVADA